MPTKVIMPQLGESVNEGTISRWLKAEGEQVNEYDPLLEINTDKVDTEIPSPTSGTVLKILASEGETIEIGTVLAWIGEEGEPIPAEGEAPKNGREAAPSLAPSPVVEEAREAVPPAQVSLPPAGRERDLGFISPVVARIASEQGVDLYQIKGTGQNNRITKKDVLAYIQERQNHPRAEPSVPSTPVAAPTVPPLKPIPTPEAAPVPVLPGEILPLSPVRKAIAEHMVHSKRTSPHVTTVMEIDLSRIVAHREANKAAFAHDGVNLTYTAYFVSALVAGLKTHPIVNSSWSDEGVLIHSEINIGMATSLGEAGLIVPVIKNADSYSLLGLARVINDLANRARARQLKPDEVKGGTFTITNHGTSGSLFATPIINQPQCAILGVGMVQKRVIVINDAIAIRPMAYVSLTFDHRILDGAIADYFLGKVVEYLQNWS